MVDWLRRRTAGSPDRPGSSLRLGDAGHHGSVPEEAAAGWDPRTAGIRITRAQLEIYRRYGGDDDRLARSASPRERALLSDSAWFVMQRLFFEAANLRAGHAAPEYAADILRTLREATESEEVAQEILRLA